MTAPRKPWSNPCIVSTQRAETLSRRAASSYRMQSDQSAPETIPTQSTRRARERYKPDLRKPQKSERNCMVWADRWKRDLRGFEISCV